MSRTALIAKNTAVQVLGRGIGTILGLVTLGVMAGYLGTEGYGEFTTATTFLQFFGILVDLGLSLTAVAMLSEAGADRDKLASNIFSLRVVTAAGLFALAPIVVLAFPYSGAIKTGVLVASASFFLISVNQVLVSMLQQTYRMERAAVAEVLGRLGLLAVVWAAARWDLGIGWMFVALVVGNLLTTFWNWLLVRTLARLRWECNFAVWKAILVRSWPIAVSIALNLVYLKSDVLVLSLTRAQSEVGLYGAAYKVLDVLTVLPIMFMGLVLPLLSRAWSAGERDEFNRLLQRAFDFLALLALPLVAGTWAVGRDLMVLVTSPAFAESGRLLGVLILAAGAVFFGSMFGHAVIALGKQRASVKWYAIDAAVSLLGYILLVPRWGAPAAAAVTVFSELFVAASLGIITGRASGFVPRFGQAVRAALAALLMMIVVLTIPPEWHVLFRIALGAAAYVIAALTFGAVTPQQLKEMLPKRA